MSFEYHPETASLVVAVGGRKYGPALSFFVVLD